MAPAAAAPRRGGRRAAIILSLLVSHGLIFGLGYSWHSLWGDYVATPTHLAQPGGAAAPATGGSSAFLAAAALVGEGGAAAAAAAGASAAAAEREARATAARNAGDRLRAAAAAEAAIAKGSGEAAAAGAAGAAGAAEQSPRAEAAAADKQAATPAPALQAGEPGRVAELGQGGTEAWLDAAKPFIVNNTAIYTWTNFHMRDFLLNFLLHMKQARRRGGLRVLRAAICAPGPHACGGACPASAALERHDTQPRASLTRPRAVAAARHHVVLCGRHGPRASQIPRGGASCSTQHVGSAARLPQRADAARLRRLRRGWAW